MYDALERLIEKGLVSYIKENEKRYYFAENPQRIGAIAKEQKEQVDSVLQQLSAMFNEKKEKQETTFYRGLEGIKSIFEDQIAEGQAVYIIGASYNANEILKYYMPHYTSKRVKHKVPLYLIYCGGKRAIDVPLGESRYLPESYASPVSTNIYADKVAILIWEPELAAILIKNKEVAKAYKNYFNILWKIAKQR